MGIYNYWAHKEHRALGAKHHLDYVQSVYKSQIVECVRNTKVYSGQVSVPDGMLNRYDEDTEVFVVNMATATTIYLYALDDGKLAALNFASFTEPGGKFIDGSGAQEESLCQESILYPVLLSFKDTYYKENYNCRNNGLYSDRALYSPGIVFCGAVGDANTSVECDIITCAAPNLSYINCWSSIPYEENLNALRKRIDFVLSIAAANGVDNLILGAFGCGVFGQRSYDVALIFDELIKDKYKRAFRKVIFAVPNWTGHRGNYYDFVDRFEKRKG